MKIIKENFDNIKDTENPDLIDAKNEIEAAEEVYEDAMEEVADKDSIEAELGVSDKDNLPDEEEFPKDVMNKISLDESLFEDVNDFDKDDLINFVYDKITSVLENLAIEANSKVPGYSAEWCADEQPAYLEDAIIALVDSTVEELLTYKD